MCVRSCGGGEDNNVQRFVEKTTTCRGLWRRQQRAEVCGEDNNVQRFVEKPLASPQLETTRWKWEETINMDLKKIYWRGGGGQIQVAWIYIVQFY
jgi:hypothetical protein